MFIISESDAGFCERCEKAEVSYGLFGTQCRECDPFHKDNVFYCPICKVECENMRDALVCANKHSKEIDEDETINWDEVIG